MKKSKKVGLSTDEETIVTEDLEIESETTKECIEPPEQEVLPPPTAWHTFLQDASENDIIERFSGEAEGILTKHLWIPNKYCTLGIMDWGSTISPWDLDRIYSDICAGNSNHEKDVLLILYSRGGNIEPAYQISKLCKLFSKEKFVAVVPRQAKSAATLIAIGADQIHMGLLGQLGPIDPQLDNLPALGVSQALESIASLSEKFPKSSDMFAKYLRMALTVEQIGYYERISESAVQYAERLLSNKQCLPQKASDIAKELVHEYKDHGFVIDIDEAKQHLGNAWIFTGTPEVAAAEEIYSLINRINIWLNIYSKNKRLLVCGDFRNGVYIFQKS